MAMFEITSKEKHGNMPAGTTLRVDSGGFGNCEQNKIKEAIKRAGFDSRAQEANHPCYWNIEKIR